MARIVIFANGVLTQPDLLQTKLKPDDRIFCADGGTRHALALGLTPETIIGDLDSLEPELVAELETAGVTIQRHPADKDQTDLELALELAVAERDAELVKDGREAVGATVGIPKRQDGRDDRQRDELDDLMDGLGALDL